VVGVARAFVRPFMTMVVFTVAFSRIAKLPSEGTAPYAMLVLAGLLPWSLVSSIFSDASNVVELRLAGPMRIEPLGIKGG
jgi:lipopolysaccharide transport system permease protein